jgi:hypothetical protein
MVTGEECAALGCKTRLDGTCSLMKGTVQMMPMNGPQRSNTTPKRLRLLAAFDENLTATGTYEGSTINIEMVYSMSIVRIK